MGSINIHSFDKPDEVREFPHGRIELVQVGDQQVARTTFEPGWRWSNDVKPIAETDWCQFHHIGYMLQGTMQVQTPDGQETQFNAGELAEIEPGHDAWVVGNEKCVMVDWGTASEYAKPSSS